MSLIVSGGLNGRTEQAGLDRLDRHEDKSTREINDLLITLNINNVDSEETFNLSMPSCSSCSPLCLN